MKTALYGVACYAIGGTVYQYWVEWPWSFRGLVTFGIVAVIYAVAYFIEAMTISKFVWGEDHYER